MNFLVLQHSVKTDHERDVVSKFLNENYLTNGTKSQFFDEVPTFSIIHILSFIEEYERKYAHLSPFFSDLQKLLQFACGVEPRNSGKALEMFHSYFERMLRSMICNETVQGYCKIISDPAFSSSSSSSSSGQQATKTLSELYPQFGVVVGSGDTKTKITPGKIITGFNESSATSVDDGDVVLPSKPNNPGFDIMIKTSIIRGDVAQDAVILLECKSRSPAATTGLEPKVLQDKVSKTFSFYKDPEDSTKFKWGTVSTKWENVVMVLISSYTNLPLTINKDDFDYNQFPGTILVSNKYTLANLYRSPLNNCGLFLLDHFRTDDLTADKKTAKKVAKNLQ